MRRTLNLTRSRLRPDLLLLAIAVVAAAWITTRSLDAKSLWIDEILSKTYADQSVRGLFAFFVHGELNMALYHFLLHFWLRLGDSEVAIRSLSVIFALAALPLAYALGAQLLSRRAGTLAAILLALNGAFYSFAREARSYSLTILLVIAASFFFVRALHRGRSADWLAYVVTAVLAVYAHLFAMSVILAHLCSLPFWRGRRIDRWRAGIAGAAILALLAPAVAYVVTGDRSLTTDPDTRLRDVLDLFRWYASGNRPLLLVYVVAALAALVGAVRRWLRVDLGAAWPEFFLVVWIAVPIGVDLVISYTIDPIFEFRYLLVVLPAFILLVARGVAGAASAALFIALALLASAVSARSLDLCTPGCATPTQDFRSATAFISSRAAADDEFVFDPPYLAFAFAYYVGHTREKLTTARKGVPAYARTRRSGLKRRAWVLVDQGDRNSLAYRGMRPLDPRWHLVSAKPFDSLLVADLYVRRR